MKIVPFVIFRSLVVGLGLLSSFTIFGQTSTITSGNWNTGGNWSGGVPGGATTSTVDHIMTLDANLVPSGATYTFNAAVEDPDGGSNYSLSISGSGIVDVNANLKIGGTLLIQNNGELTVRSGDTVTIGYPGSIATSIFRNNAVIVVEAGGVLIFNGNLQAQNGSGTTIDGELIINGNYTSSNGAIIDGSGTMNTSGTITSNNGSTVFGSGNNCTTGPCSGNNLCATNSISAAQSICAGQSPAALTGNNPGGAFTYKWQISTTSSTGGFSDIAGATAQNFSSGALTTDTWYRRIVTNGACSATSLAVKITITGSVPTITSSGSTTFCSGCSVILTSSPATSYSWSTGATTASITVLTSGNYTVTATSGGCATPSIATSVTVSPCATYSWTGATSNAWSTASNWNKCTVPGTTSDVTIPNVVTSPSISGTANCNQLTVDAGAALTINFGATLNIYGDLNNNGNYADIGTTVFTGPAAQTVSGVTTFNNLTINNANGVSLNDPTSVNSVLTLTSGTLNSGGNLTVDLNTGGISGTGSGSISGNVTVSKNVNSAKYHYISSPLSGVTANEWNDDVLLSFGQYANLYSYNEAFANADKAIGWEPVTSLLNALSPMKGYALYFKGAASIDVTGAYNHSLVPSNITLTNTLSADPASDGWNLIGNPYPSTLNWDASGWTKTNIGNAIYYWDPVNSRYATYVGGLGTNGGTRFIPAMQSFWVKVSVSGGTGTFGMNNNVRTTSTNPSIWRLANTDNILRLRASNGLFDDETVLRFRDDAENTFDQEVDAYKMTNTGNTPSIYTHIGDDKYSINSLADTSKDITVPLHLKVASSGEYTIQAEEEGMFDASYSILLEDRILDSIQDLRYNPTYTFPANVEDTSGRFYITFRKSEVTSINTAKAGSKVAIRSSEHTVYFDFNNTSSEGYIGIYNLLGRPVAEISNADISSGKYMLEFPDETGIYIVKTVVGGELFTQKVYLK